MHTASTEEDAGCGVEVKNGSQVDDKNMTLPWIICEVSIACVHEGPPDHDPCT